MTEQKIIDRVKDLLRLAEDKSNVNESAAAWGRAQALISKHNLSMALVLSNDVNPNVVYQTIDAYTNKGKAITWKSYLLNTLTKINNCYWFHWSGHRYYAAKLVGQSENVEITKYFLESISSQIEGLCKSYMYNLGMGKQGAKRMANSFKLGAVDTVCERLRSSHREVQKEYEGTRALVILDYQSAKIEQWATEHFKLKTKQSQSIIYNPSARDAGQAAGKHVSLNHGLPCKQTKLLK